MALRKFWTFLSLSVSAGFWLWRNRAEIARTAGAVGRRLRVGAASG
jgi:hypothetical protein